MKFAVLIVSIAIKDSITKPTPAKIALLRLKIKIVINVDSIFKELNHAWNAMEDSILTTSRISVSIAQTKLLIAIHV